MRYTKLYFVRRFTPQEREYIIARFETQKNITHLAVELKAKFDFEGSDTDAIRRAASWLLDREGHKKSKADLKRLFFDIETSYYLVPTFNFWKTNINPDNIIKEKKIICICYKWQSDDKVHTLVWDKNQDDTKLIKDFIQVIKKADELIAHNGDKFDIKEIRTRALLTENLMFPVYRTLDTLKKARQYFRFPSNKLDYLGKVLNLGRKLDHEGMKMWIDICEHKDKDALAKMIEYCQNDVILLEDVYHAMSPYIYHNTNFAILKGGKKWHCPECASDNVQLSHTDATAMGVIRRHMKCNDCRKFFKISNKTYLFMLEYLMRGKK